MKNLVKIKSFSHGISLHISAEESMESILNEIGMKFKESAAFFKDAKMALSIVGRELNDEEEKAVIQAIEENSDIKILCLMEQNDTTQEEIRKAIEEYQNAHAKEKDIAFGQFYKGTLKGGQVLKTDSSIIILGDVEPGANVISAKDIIVLGGLYGNAYAGSKGEKGHYIIALDVSAECLKIDDCQYKTKKKPKWNVKPKFKPQIAHTKEQSVILEPLMRDFMDIL